MPFLGVLSLAILRMSGHRPPVVYYVMLPRYLRGVCRVLRLQPARMAKVLGLVFGPRIETVPKLDEIDGYPAIHFGAMSETGAVSAGILPVLELEPCTNALAALIGREAALAFIALDVAHYQIWPWLLAVKTASVQNPGGLGVVHPVGWDSTHLSRVTTPLPTCILHYFVWPKWYRAFCNLCSATWLKVAVSIALIRMTLRRGVRVGARPRKKFHLMTEYVDPDRLRGAPSDADWWIADSGLPKEQVLFFLTGRQRRHLRREGYAFEQVLRPLQDKGCCYTVLDNLSYSGRIFHDYWNLLKRLRPVKQGWLAGALLRAWNEYLEYIPLVRHFDANIVLSTRTPNGDTWLRLEGAALTGICRKHGIVSWGFQNRIIYGPLYEFYFECFDATLVWSARWYRQLGAGARFNGRLIEVGCPSLDSLLPCKARTAKPPGNVGRSVLIFPAEVGTIHYTLGYGLRFLMGCTRLASRHPSMLFQVKCKDPRDADVFLADRGLREGVGALANFSFLKVKRHEYGSLLASADIVLAIGLTTPGTEALLMGKPVVYYSELGYAAEALESISGLVAHSEKELEELFESAVLEPGFNQAQIAGVEDLDPFRDGHCRDRILSLFDREASAA